MAMGNWASRAWNLDGQPCGDSFDAGDGRCVEVYKNWLYVSDAPAWREGCGYTNPIVMCVESGMLRYGPISIHAIRGPQYGIYAAVWTTESPPHGMLAIGVYGFRGHQWVGVERASIDWFERKLNARAFDGVPRRDSSIVLAR